MNINEGLFLLRQEKKKFYLNGQHVFMSQEFIYSFKSSNSILLINGLLDHSITGKYLIRQLVIRLLKTLKSLSMVK